ncbi:hypothetical protein L596_011226 [Steinernema carpocapsae]|uniref:Uncharacterized protein n=1 Tax=Steinernema carpocapsae TaxID=34508 RepID=A0A4U5NT38_STECR|nr:hypothetical protein L596_011226 [Steinernema carpocapsae]
MNDYFLRLPGARRRYDYNPHVHGVFVDKFVSENFWGVQNQWASCSFHPSLDCEHLAVLGDEDGNIGFADVRKVSKCNDYSVDDGDYLCPSWLVKNFKGHDAVVLDVNFLPADPSKFVTVSGDFTAKVWDVEANRNLFSLNGHDKSVRALACWQNDPNMFATGGRDGIICIWDIRQPPPKDQPAITKGPLNLIENAHLQTNIHADVGLRPRTPVRKGYVHASPLVPPNITSLVYADDHLLISGSSTIESGLGVWDLRTSCNQMMSKPVRVCKFPDSKLGRGKGVTSLCIDKSRFGLYAAATDGSVHEFVLSDLKWKYEETDEPPRMVVSRTSIRRNRITTCRREYTGFCKNTFYAKVVTSPITDHIMCSYGDELVRIWDTKETAKKISPSHSLPGHTGEVRIQLFKSQFFFRLRLLLGVQVVNTFLHWTTKNLCCGTAVPISPRRVKTDLNDTGR